MKTKLKKRNSQIAERVLLGESSSKLATEYELSVTRINQILQSYCFERNRDAYMKIIETRKNQSKLELLRDSAEDFMIPEQHLDKLKRRLYTIEELSKSVVNSLRPEGILTVEDLLKFDIEQLKRAPNIGPVGIQQIRDFKEKYKID